MKLSVIIPAFNEQAELPQCLDLVQRAFETITTEREMSWELIVTDNNSTDRTSEIASAAGAQVVFEPKNQIARARNAGGSVATGDWFLFIDADSRLHVDSIRQMLSVIDAGHCGGGGCLVRMDDAPLWGRCGIRFWNMLSIYMQWAPGSFVFSKAEAFHDVGGFNEEFYAAEELDFSKALKQWCRDRHLEFMVLQKQPHASSSRKFQIYNLGEICRLISSMFFSYRRTVRNKQALDIFYDGRRGASNHAKATHNPHNHDDHHT